MLNATKVKSGGLTKLFKRDKGEPPFQFPVPLISVSVNASVVHAVAQVEVTQVYVNKEKCPIEAIFHFPTNPDGAVTHFQAELEGRVIKAVVKPTDEAKKDYAKAVAKQITSFLGEETKPDIFKIRVGFLKPGEQVKVIIGYVTEVKNEPGTNNIRFYIPTTIAPRYVSPSESDSKANDIRNMQFSSGSPAPLSIKVVVSLQGGIKLVTSPTHEVVISKVGNTAPRKLGWDQVLVELSTEITDMDRDFVLNIEPEEEAHKPRLYSEKREDGSTACMVQLIPSFKLDDQKTELIFLVDRSGSMQGQSIKLAREALVLLLHSMPADCYFNVVGFGSSYKLQFPQSVKYSDSSLSAAMHDARGLGADLGGTELFDPLQYIYKQRGIDGYLRQLFVLTDGEVSNTMRVLGIAQANASKVRVFALGVGNGASHHLIEGLAKAGGGTSAFVTYGERIDKKVLNQLKNALQPSLIDIELEWEGVSPPVDPAIGPPVQLNKEKTLLGYNKPIKKQTSTDDDATGNCNKQSPKKIPPVYDGSQMLVFGVFKDGCPTGVTIKAQSPDGPLTVHVKNSSENDVGQTGMLHRLAAIKLVRELELEESALKYQCDCSRIEEIKDRLTKDIVTIACENGITSKHTSFVGVDLKEGKRCKGDWVMETRNVPCQYAHGWHGRSWSLSANPMTFQNKSSHLKCSSGNRRFSLQRKSCASFSSRVQSCALSACTYPPSSYADMGTDSEENSPIVIQLIRLQSYDGSYTLSKELASIFGKLEEEIKDEAKINDLPEDEFVTGLAITFFRTKLEDVKDLWELVVKKAQKWLEKMVPMEQAERIIILATKFLFGK